MRYLRGRRFFIPTKHRGEPQAPYTDKMDKQKERGAPKMDEQEKKMLAAIAQAFLLLPESKKEYMLGYAEGTLAAKAQKEPKKEEKGA